MRRELLDYELPPELIASRPLAERDGARLMVLDAGVSPAHAAVRDLDRLIDPGALLIVNNTRVFPARLLGRKVESGGRVEVLLVRRLGPAAVEHRGRTLPAERWSALGKASKSLRPGAIIVFDQGGLGGRELGERARRDRCGGPPAEPPHRERGLESADLAGANPQVLRETPLSAEIAARSGDDGLLEVLLFSPSDAPIEVAIEEMGHVPLPPYLRRPDEGADRERYQTVFARTPGAVAAPTAGLHLSTALLDRLRDRGVEIASVTLHVGLGTFQPVTAADLDDHPMHAEVFVVPSETVDAIGRARERGSPVVAVGTTVVRSLESAADPERDGHVRAAAGETRLLIQPGYRFRVVDQLLTNFHLPQSTLLALVAAFAGREWVLAAYRAAIAERYRFFSYGDAMLIRGRSDP